MAESSSAVAPKISGSNLIKWKTEEIAISVIQEVLWASAF
jgi:hypothetical protein